MNQLFQEYTKHATEHFPHLYDEALLKILNKGYKNIPAVCGIIDASPWTLIHNDCHLQNLCLRKMANSKSGNRLCLYDWELMRLGVPQQDLLEFLMHIMPEGSGTDIMLKYIEYCRRTLEKELLSRNVSDYIRMSLDSDRFLKVFDMSVVELLWNRLGAYCMVGRFPFAPKAYNERVIGNTVAYLKYAAPKYDFLS